MQITHQKSQISENKTNSLTFYCHNCLENWPDWWKQKLGINISSQSCGSVPNNAMHGCLCRHWNKYTIPLLSYLFFISFYYLIFFYQALVGGKVDEPYVRIDWWQSIDTVAKKLIHFAFSVLTSSGGSTWSGCLFQVNVYKTVEISWVEACEG